MCPVSDAGHCRGRNAREAACFPTATTGKHQAAACQCVCEFYFIPTLSPVMVTYWNWLTVLSVLRNLLIKGASGSDSIFMGIFVTQTFVVTICCVFASMRDKCRFSAPW